MKIGIDARPALNDHYSPVGNYTFFLLRFLQALDQANEYRFFWPDDEFKDLTPEKLELFNSMAKDDNLYWEKSHLPNCIKRENLDLIHLTNNGAGFPEPKSCPVVITVHHLLPYFFPELMNKKELKKTLDLFPKVVSEAETILVVSPSLKKELQELMGIPENKITVTSPAPEEIYNCLDRHEARAWVKEHYGLEKEFLLYAGGLGRGKNLKRLLISYYQVNKDLTRQVQLVLVGNPYDDWNELSGLARALGIQDQVVFIEFSPPQSLVYLYNAARAFVYPSFYEGYPQRVAEAMACGVPALASDIPAIRDILGGGGLMVNPYDTLKIAEGMFNLLEKPDLAEAKAKEALERAGAFSWTRTALDTLKAYHKNMK